MSDDKPIFYDPENEPRPKHDFALQAVKDRIERLERLIVAIGRSVSYRLTGFYPIDRLIEEIERDLTIEDLHIVTHKTAK